MSLTADPPACTVPAAGGASTHKLVNGGADKLIFKVCFVSASSQFNSFNPSRSSLRTTMSTVSLQCSDSLIHLDQRISKSLVLLEHRKKTNLSFISPMHQLMQLMLRLHLLQSLLLEHSQSRCRLLLR
ncbi:hypothetical protein CRE_03898 [Caenorhabditis remanei]|uniref:Uncharacterized protein n=1 Tax=Caenorhabditis remanei TaxID=31234 RepID=E3LXQ2_CAERE|nr:hypothetical protein CRE_03898 [Caenorhabditis remanei]